MMEAENNLVNSASESQPEPNEENEEEVEVEVLRLKKYGCGIRMSDWVSGLGWYGLALSVLSILASIGLMLTTLIFPWVCGSRLGQHLQQHDNRHWSDLHVLQLTLDHLLGYAVERESGLEYRRI